MNNIIGSFLFLLSRFHLWSHPKASTGIAYNEMTLGYGKLNFYGYWQFPVNKNLINFFSWGR